MENTKEDPKEVFQTFSKVLEALLLTYSNQYPMHPGITMGMVMKDLAAWINDLVENPPMEKVTMIPLLEKAGEDLAVRIGGHSTYEQARMALASAGGET